MDEQLADHHLPWLECRLVPLVHHRMRVRDAGDRRNFNIWGRHRIEVSPAHIPSSVLSFPAPEVLSPALRYY